MGIRSGLYNVGARVAQSVASSRTVGRSVGARTAIPMGPIGSTGRRYGMVGGASARLPSGRRLPRGRMAARTMRGAPVGRANMPRAMNTRAASARVAAGVPRAGRSRTRRAVGWAARNPLVVGGTAGAIGFNAGRQDTGPGITTTNTTGMYQY